jgi:peptidoglycan/xylan/chitin deacetylase (PgdA/CDA1 family)
MGIFLTGVPYLYFLSCRLRNIPLTRILCWHKIPDQNQFKGKIQFLVKHFNIISVNDFIKSKSLSTKRINLILSFDDGYKSWVDNAIPVLKEFQLPALFFVTSSFVDKSEEEEKIFMKNLRVSWARGLSQNDLHLIANNQAFDVGGHGCHHLDLSYLNREELEQEVLKDKKILGNIIGKEIVYFAFPFGHQKHVNTEVFLYYQWVFSIVPGFNRSVDPGRIIYRDSIQLNYSNLLFKSWLSGAYDWYWRLK